MHVSGWCVSFVASLSSGGGEFSPSLETKHMLPPSKFRQVLVPVLVMGRSTEICQDLELQAPFAHS